jgi:FKBP-type peptidyl-prolyl cis-trans isomerase
LFAAALSLCGCDNDAAILEEVSRIEKERVARHAQLAAQSPAWLAEKRGHAGAVTTASGLVYEVLRAPPDPSLPTPTRASRVLIDYEGRLPDGTVFDSSLGRGGAQFDVAALVPGVAEMLTLMRPGEEVVAYIPAALAYGAEGAGEDVPPHVALEFRIRLIAFERDEGSMAVTQ